MFTLAIIVVFFTMLQLMVAAANLLLKPDLDDNLNDTDYLVSVLIPARNEAKNIGIILNDVCRQPYKNLEIIVFDDQSEDGTARIVEEIAKTDSRIQLVRSDNLPAGWLGKNFACHSLATQAKGDYLLFLDADVRIQGDIIRQVTGYAEKHKLGLLSLFPRQQMVSFGEKITVPVMNFILLTLLPLPFVLWSRFASLAAANGQFMLFNTQIYKSLNPHEYKRKHKVEDIAIARYFKHKRIPVACLTGDESIQCRMYRGFDEAVNGFSKNITAFFGNSFLPGVLFWLTTTLGIIPVFISFQFGIVICYIFMVVVIRILVSVTSKQSIRNNLLYLIPQQLVIGWLLFRAFTFKYLIQYQWKGRNIG